MLGPQRCRGAGTLGTARCMTSLTHCPQGTEICGLPRQPRAGQVAGGSGGGSDWGGKIGLRRSRRCFSLWPLGGSTPPGIRGGGA